MLGKWLGTFKGNTKISWALSIVLIQLSIVVNLFYFSSKDYSGTEKALMDVLILVLMPLGYIISFPIGARLITKIMISRRGNG